jgi:Ca2+/H+ antiporter
MKNEAGALPRFLRDRDERGKKAPVAVPSVSSTKTIAHANVRAMTSLFTSWLDLLLVCVPIRVVLELLKADHLAVFISAGLAIIPLAGLLGRATEHLTAHVGAGIGGLLNASFGNAAELIIALAALREGLHDVA